MSTKKRSDEKKRTAGSVAAAAGALAGTGAMAESWRNELKAEKHRENLADSQRSANINEYESRVNRQGPAKARANRRYVSSLNYVQEDAKKLAKTTKRIKLANRAAIGAAGVGAAGVGAAYHYDRKVKKSSSSAFGVVHKKDISFDTSKLNPEDIKRAGNAAADAFQSRTPKIAEGIVNETGKAVVSGVKANKKKIAIGAGILGAGAGAAKVANYKINERRHDEMVDATKSKRIRLRRKK